MASIRVRGTLKEAKTIRDLLELNGWRVINSRMGAESQVQTGAIFWIYAWAPDPNDTESHEEAENGDLLELR